MPGKLLFEAFMDSPDSDEAPPSRTTQPSSLSPDLAGNILRSQGWAPKQSTRSSSFCTSSESSDEYVRFKESEEMPVLPEIMVGLRRRESKKKK